MFDGLHGALRACEHLADVFKTNHGMRSLRKKGKTTGITSGERTKTPRRRKKADFV